MKRTAALVLTLTFVLAACGTTPSAATPPVTPSAAPSAEPVPAPGSDTLSNRLSPLCSWALDRLDYYRTLYYRNNNAETHIKETIKLFLYMHYNMFAERGYAFPDFSPFLNPDGEGYDELLYFVAEMKYIHLDESYDEGVQWHNVDLDFRSFDLNVDRAVAVVDARYETVRGDGSGGGMSNSYAFVLDRIDGVWYLSGISPATIFGSGSEHGSYEDLLQAISRLEASAA